MLDLTLLRRLRASAVLATSATVVFVVGCDPAAPPLQLNNPPVAKVGANQVVIAGASVTLDGSGSSDPDGTALGFSWRQTTGTAVTLSSNSEPTTTFTAPASGTALAFELAVTDGESSSAAQTNVSVQPFSQTVQIVELEQPSILDDPAMTGNFPDGFTIEGLPDAPQAPPNVGAPNWIEFIEYAPNVEVDLAPGEVHEVELQRAGPALLLGSARWVGTIEALDVTIDLDGVVLQTGVPYSIGFDRGGTAMKVQTDAGGRAALTVTNTSTATVRVRIHFGALAL